MIGRLFTRRWLLATGLVLVGTAVLVRLGIWQLDRLDWRRSLNARITEQSGADTLTLDTDSLKLDLYSMEYRHVVATGQFVPEDEIVLRNQIWPGETGEQLGVKLYTPLLIEGSDQAILVERGWIPQADAENRTAYVEPGTVTISGWLRRAETDYNLGMKLQPDPPLTTDETRRVAWNNLDLQRLHDQSGVELVTGAYLQELPEGAQAQPPYAAAPEIDLSEGSHLGYAIQWFTFATILLVGYPFYARRQEEKKHSKHG